MASKTEERPQKEEMPEKEGPETAPDSPLLDPSDAAVKKLIRSAKKRDELAALHVAPLPRQLAQQLLRNAYDVDPGGCDS